MTDHAYLFFHLNLAFSSVEPKDYPAIIKKCYHPLLNLSEELDIPIGIEMSGWTLQVIKKLDPIWVVRFKNLIEARKCELIGSGYCQIIAPLVPYKLNRLNQEFGIEVYSEILETKPRIALINEMAFSSAMIDIYHDLGYCGVAMDGDNLKLASDPSFHGASKITEVQSSEGLKLPLLCTDTILFQKMQHFAHGDISMAEYLKHLEQRNKDTSGSLCLYSNDAEVFDYRPGRFSTEKPTHPEGEWNRLRCLFAALKDRHGTNFILPSEALDFSQSGGGLCYKNTNAAYPVPVKKQAKYNVARWAVTGRDDVRINTLCHRLFRKMMDAAVYNKSDLKILCELWASDLRTHVTSKKWEDAQALLALMLEKYDVSNVFDNKINYPKHSLPTNHKKINENGFAIQEIEDRNRLLVEAKNLKLELNTRRGLTIDSLAFSSHEFEKCIGRLEHGYFKNILLGADFYSGGVVIDSPVLRKKLTDLEAVKPKIMWDSERLRLAAKIVTDHGTILKEIVLIPGMDRVTIRYNFDNFDVIGSVRVGICTFVGNFSRSDKVWCSNGGAKLEEFNIKSNFDHSKPVSGLVSCTSGFGATTGVIAVGGGHGAVALKWDETEARVMPMMMRATDGDNILLRTFFTLKESDDTVKSPSAILPFEFSIEHHKI